jgi:cyclase
MDKKKDNQEGLHIDNAAFISGDPKGNMFYGAQPMIFELAKKLRNNVTPTEMILWARLKEYFPKLKFRRQHPVSHYVADFYCHSEKLIIEIDGSIHKLEQIKFSDSCRQKNLEDLGIIVLRFTTHEITHDLEVVLQKIDTYLNHSF